MFAYFLEFDLTATLTPERDNSTDSLLEELCNLVETHPHSPLFARLADQYIQRDAPAEALKILLEGLKKYPDYATALLLTGKTQILLRQYNDARDTLTRVLRRAPACSAARSLLEGLKDLELRFPPIDSFSGGSANNERFEFRSRGGSHKKSWSWKENLIPTPEFLSGSEEEKEQTGKADNAPDILTEDTGTDIERLATRLEGARIPVLSAEESAQSDIEEENRRIETVDIHSRPITETLAAIYANQGKYKEAIEAYRMLREQHRDRSNEFTLRIAELKELLSRREKQQ